MVGTFSMWDWVGGRTSELSVVSLLPAVLQSIDIYEMLRRAKDCDEFEPVSIDHKNTIFTYFVSFVCSG